MNYRCLVAAAVLAASAVPALSGGDPVAGAKAFRYCQACHTATQDVNKVGPSLMGVVGRAAGSLETYRYSQAMKDFGAAGNVWTEQNLSAFLTRPREHVKGTSMAFPGVKKPEDLANIIAYLTDPRAAGQ